MPSPILAESLEPKSGSPYPEPFKSNLGDAEWRTLGAVYGLTQFGMNLETLAPGAQSSMRHWHTLEDEAVYVLEGELTLIMDDGEFEMTAGSFVGFKAGERNGHHLVNRSDATAKFLVVGSRIPGDDAFYPDDDIAWFATPDGSVMVHKDGSPYPRK
jgi:uncharacterized cupin superfamily protein